MNYNTSEILLELEAILKANKEFNKIVVAESQLQTNQETEQVAIYLDITHAIPKVVRAEESTLAYDYSGMFLLTLNVDCSNDKFLLHNTVDSVQRSILNDNQIWGSLVDRDIVTIEFDNATSYPKRTAAIVLEVKYRLACK